MCLFLKSKKNPHNLTTIKQKNNVQRRMRAWKKQINTLKTISSDGYHCVDRLSFPLNWKVSAKVIMFTNLFSARVIFHHLQYQPLKSLQKTLGFCTCHSISLFHIFPLSLFLSLYLPLFPLFLSLSPFLSYFPN